MLGSYFGQGYLRKRPVAADVVEADPERLPQVQADLMQYQRRVAERRFQC
jgi:hypothetical protein